MSINDLVAAETEARQIDHQLWFVKETRRKLNGQGQSVSETHVAVDGPACAYRGLNDSGCAVGIWIPDEKYSADMEGDTVNALISNFGRECLDSKVQDIPTRLLRQAQVIHDERRSWNESGQFSLWGRELWDKLQRRVESGKYVDGSLSPHPLRL